MGTKRKLKDDSIPRAKHRYSLRSKSKCNQFELENLCLRFPVLCDEILNQLNPQSRELVKDFLASGMIKLWNQEPIG